MNEYMKDRWRKRRAAAIEQLGGLCIDCGGTERLEFDHRDPAEKSFTMSRASSFSEERFQAELRKCVLRCFDCHLTKTKREVGVEHGGGLTGKQNCRCELCAPLKNAWAREYKRRKRTEHP